MWPIQRNNNNVTYTISIWEEKGWTQLQPAPPSLWNVGVKWITTTLLYNLLFPSQRPAIQQRLSTTLPTSFFSGLHNGSVLRKVEKESWRWAKQGRYRQSTPAPRSIEVTVGIIVLRTKGRSSCRALLLEFKRRLATRSFWNDLATSRGALWRPAFKLQTISAGTRNSSSSYLTFPPRIL